MTDFTHRQLRRLQPDTLDRVASTTPIGRVARPHEIAAVIAFLASEETSFVVGQVYNADGGTHMWRAAKTRQLRPAMLMKVKALLP